MTLQGIREAPRRLLSPVQMKSNGLCRPTSRSFNYAPFMEGFDERSTNDARMSGVT